MASKKLKGMLEVVYRDPKMLIPYEKNARTHSPEQIEQLRASIREFGFTNPILLRDDGLSIGAGHGRVAAAILESLDVVPTIIISGLTETQWRAYILADNKLAMNAGWNEELLLLELQEIQALDFNIGTIGFTAFELKPLLTPTVVTPPDEFKAYGDGITTEHICPSCNYRWSGKVATGQTVLK